MTVALAVTLRMDEAVEGTDDDVWDERADGEMSERAVARCGDEEVRGEVGWPVCDTLPGQTEGGEEHTAATAVTALMPMAEMHSTRRRQLCCSGRRGARRGRCCC